MALTSCVEGERLVAEDEGEQPTDARPTEDSSGSGPGGRAAPELEIELASAGSGERHELRLSPEPGDVTTAVMTEKTHFDQGLGTGAGQLIEYRFTVEVEEVGDGEIVASYRYDSFDVLATSGATAGQERAIEQQLAPMEGLTMTVRSDDRGRPLSIDADVPDDLDPMVADTLTQILDQSGNLQAPFPEDPVGMGAQWTGSWRFELNGLETTTRYTYELVELDGSSYVLDVHLDQGIAGPQELELGPGMGSGTVTDLENRGDGQIRGELESLLPLRSTMEMSGGQTLEVEGMGSTETLDQSMQLELELVTE